MEVTIATLILFIVSLVLTIIDAHADAKRRGLTTPEAHPVLIGTTVLFFVLFMLTAMKGVS